MNVKSISRNTGYGLLVSALFMLLSAIVSFFSKDGAFTALMISALITGLVGAFPFIFVGRTSSMTLKEGYLTIVLSWLLSFIFGMLPYLLWGGPFTFQNAWFESVSGFTTTGATILADVEALPPGLLLWRASTHFIGGLGVVVFLLLIIPNASPVKMRLTNLELSSLSKHDYKVSSNKTVYVFTYVYVGIFILSLICYLIAGMKPIDAFCHAFSVSATGGFSTKNTSIAAFGSPLIEGITMFFMLASSIHFGLIYLSVVNRSIKPFNNPVLKFYLICVLAFTICTGITLKVNAVEPNFGKALWISAFQTISVASTTGFAISDNATWPLATNIFLMFMAVMCGCAGSTTGGIKADRMLVLLKSIGRHMGRVLHPSLVNEVKLGGRVIRDDELLPQILYIAQYGLILGVSIIISMMIGVNPHSSFAASLSSLSNVGPAIAELGTMGNFDSLSAGAKFLYTVDMFLGRIEIYPVLAVFAMIFDGHKRSAA